MVTRKDYFIIYLEIGFVLSACFLGETSSTNDLKGFDDSVLFKINWPGRSGDDLGLPDFPNDETLLVTTENNEKYKCLLPHFQEKEKDSSEGYNGPTPYELLSPVFSDFSSCSYRLESYWTYELCHGKHIRQYHEEREGKKVLVQEYYLGKWDEEQASNLEKILAKEEKELRPRSDIPFKKIDGLNMPFVQLNMTGGTVCDLNQQPRRTKVIYVCYLHGKHEIYSLKETSTCEYEVIVLSPLLCLHPKYKPQESGENIVNCHPLEKTSKKPKNLLAMEAESLKLRHQKITDEQLQNVFAGFSVVKNGWGQEPEHLVRVEIHPVEPTEEQADETPAPSDTSPVTNLLSGKTCLHGGSGWWKYEFCYGKTVDQYHVEKDSRRTVINLGKFIKANHLDWLEQNPHKRPKPLALRKSISHLYSGGSICDKTGRPRQTEVKLKCLENNSSPSSVALYLLEPRACEYILGVESPLICEIIHKADENGLVKMSGSGEVADEITISLEDELEGDDEEDDVEEVDEPAIPNGDD